MISRFKRLLQLFSGSKRRPSIASSRLQIEQLEDRTVPAVLDLTTHGAIGSLGQVVSDGPVVQGVFRQFDAQPTGTGVIDSFVRIQSIKGAVQQGFNSDYRAVQFDENTSRNFTRALPLSEVPIVNLGGVEYREFLLDINQKASQPIVSLDELRIYMGSAGNLTGYDPDSLQLAGLTATFDLDAGGDNWIKLNARLNQGSGKGDMLAYIPDSAFQGGSHVYLYSKFGVNYTANSGFEEWAAGKASLTADTGKISGFVFHQEFSNSAFTPFANQIVFIDANGNNVLDNNEIFTTTDENGYYEFIELATGLGEYSTYKVRIIPTTGVTETVEGGDVLYPYDVSLQLEGQVVNNVNFYLRASRPPNN